MAPKHKRGEYYLDKKKKQFVTSSGTRLTLVPLNMMALEMIQRRFQGTATNGTPVEDEALPDTAPKPEVPEVEVDYGKGRKGTEPHPGDPDYVAAMENWQTQAALSFMTYIFAKGVLEDPPDDEVAFYRTLLPPETTAGEIKYMWVSSLLTKGDDEAGALTDAIIGMNMPTERGVEEAAASFPGDGESE